MSKVKIKVPVDAGAFIFFWWFARLKNIK